MTPDREREVFERLARLEDFARRVTGLLCATGQALDMAPMVVEAAGVTTLTGPARAAVRRLYDHADEPSEGARHLDD